MPKVTIDVKNFGADGNGTTNDTAAVLEAFAAVPSDGGMVLFPAGVYLLTQAIVINDRAITILGAGMGNTILRWGSGAGSSGINIANTGVIQTVNVSNMSLYTEQNGVGTALTINMSGQPKADDVLLARHIVRGTVSDLEIRGAIDPNVDGWLNQISLTDVMNFYVTRVSMSGNNGAGGFPDIDSVNGILAVSNYAAAGLWITDCRGLYLQNGINCQNYEGVICQGCVFDGVNIGFASQGSNAEGHHVFTHGHINALSTCVQLVTVSRGVVANNVLYSSPQAEGNTTGVLVNGSIDCFVSGNSFFHHHENLMYGIVLNNSANSNVIGTNIFTTFLDRGVHADATTYNNLIDRQLGYEAMISGNVVNDGSKNLRKSAYTLVTRSSAQEINNNSLTPITWQTQVADDPATTFQAGSPTVLTVPEGAERVILSCNIEWEPNTTGGRHVEMRKGGAQFTGAPFSLVEATGGVTAQNLVSAPIAVSTGEQFSVHVLQDSGGALDVLATSQTWFAMQILE